MARLVLILRDRLRGGIKHVDEHRSSTVAINRHRDPSLQVSHTDKPTVRLVSVHIHHEALQSRCAG